MKCNILCRNQRDQTRDLPACGFTNPTTNWKTTKQNGIMTKAHQDQRTSKSPRQPKVTNNTNAKPKLQLNFFVCSTGSLSVSFVMTPPVISKRIDKRSDVQQQKIEYLRRSFTSVDGSLYSWTKIISIFQLEDTCGRY